MAVYSPTAHAMMWQGTLLTDTVQIVRFQVKSKAIIGTGSSLSMSLPIANTAWLTDAEYDKSTSATFIVNGWYAYLPLVMQP